MLHTRDSRRRATPPSHRPFVEFKSETRFLQNAIDDVDVAQLPRGADALSAGEVPGIRLLCTPCIHLPRWRTKRKPSRRG